MIEKTRVVVMSALTERSSYTSNLAGNHARGENTIPASQ